MLAAAMILRRCSVRSCRAALSSEDKDDRGHTVEVDMDKNYRIVFGEKLGTGSLVRMFSCISVGYFSMAYRAPFVKLVTMELHVGARRTTPGTRGLIRITNSTILITAAEPHSSGYSMRVRGST